MNKRLILLIILTLLLAGCSEGNMDIREEYALTFRLAEVHPPDHPTAMAVKKFARLVEERSDGEIKIVVYDNQVLGDELSVISQVQFGAIDFARVSSSPLAEIEPKLYVLQLPYLYENSNHMWHVLNSDIGKDFLSILEPDGIVGLTWYDAGARSFYFRDRAINSLEDLDGVLVRVMQNDMMVDMVEALGGQGVGMTYGDVYKALQTGQIDGAENNLPSYETSSHYEVAPHYSMDEHVRVPEMLIASTQVRDRLTDEQWGIIMDAAMESQLYQRKLWSEDVSEASARLKNQGVEINIPDDKEAFRQAVEPVVEKYGEGYEDLIQEIRNMAQTGNE